MQSELHYLQVDDLGNPDALGGLDGTLAIRYAPWIVEYIIWKAPVLYVWSQFHTDKYFIKDVDLHLKLLRSLAPFRAYEWGKG